MIKNVFQGQTFNEIITKCTFHILLQIVLTVRVLRNNLGSVHFLKYTFILLILYDLQVQFFKIWFGYFSAHSIKLPVSTLIFHKGMYVHWSILYVKKKKDKFK